ncbi:alkyl/aryl-sulfatase [Lacrimispora sp. NSJ-141]|uniref:Alkyl/aryl-sulfatase n=1 Tax=Lientehia hominis TaxID=2897778 RepID=A0AAP2W9C2_9FIRM|nr:alkyl/aryl-sulfatase [Lientehia hominis]MCD2491727.1 alkyl/aryl-sulfatase [Lientehia hominis]
MLTKDGCKQLRDFTEKNYKETISEVAEGVWFVLGAGHSNAVFVETDFGIILIDTLDTLERGEKLLGIIRQNTGKEVKTIIYTHGHPDHRGGAGAFLESRPEIIAFEPKCAELEKADLLQDIQKLRGTRQFGYSLTDEEAVSQGIGVREGITHGERRAFVSPTTVYRQDTVTREIDGIQVEMVRLPGEAEDQIMIWFPQKEVLCCGDNYYGCFPNLYAIRGGQYRDIAQWIDSLDKIMSYPASCLLSGHTAAVLGHEEIKRTLGNFRNAFEYILIHALEGMNAGKSAEQLASELSLPPEYAELPYLVEHYGCVEWTIRAIYTAYLGWFDGNPTNLHPLSPGIHSKKMTALAGGAQNVWKTARKAMEEKEYQWCLELCDLLLSNDETACGEALLLKARALERIAEYETSANGRHYYLEYARELREKNKKG